MKQGELQCVIPPFVGSYSYYFIYISNEYFTAFKDIINVSTDIKADKNRYNLECLDILLRYNIVDKKSVVGLLDNGKLVVPGASDILKKYQKRGFK